jgi:hypothetical protein
MAQLCDALGDKDKAQAWQQKLEENSQAQQKAIKPKQN